MSEKLLDIRKAKNKNAETIIGKYGLVGALDLVHCGIKDYTLYSSNHIQDWIIFWLQLGVLKYCRRKIHFRSCISANNTSFHSVSLVGRLNEPQQCERKIESKIELFKMNTVYQQSYLKHLFRIYLKWQ